MITLNTSYSTQNNYKKYNPNFKGKGSAFLAPFKRAYGSFTDGIEKHYYAPLYSSKFVNWLSKKKWMDEDIVNHMQTLGSIIISGMYMTQTLRNKEMDDKRKKTLALNQGLTFLVSTAIAYLVSNRLVAPWNKHVAMKYAQNFLGYEDGRLEKELKEHQIRIADNYVDKHHNDEDLKAYIKEFNEKLKTDKKFEGVKKAIEEHPEEKNLKTLQGVKKFRFKKFTTPNLVHYAEKGLKNVDSAPLLTSRLKALNVLKSLLIFSSVYRFIGPVAVTPLASWISDKFIIKDNATSKAPANNNQTAVKETSNPFNQPMMAKFLGENK